MLCKGVLFINAFVAPGTGCRAGVILETNLILCRLRQWVSVARAFNKATKAHANKSQNSRCFPCPNVFPHAQPKWDGFIFKRLPRNLRQPFKYDKLNRCLLLRCVKGVDLCCRQGLCVQTELVDLAFQCAHPTIGCGANSIMAGAAYHKA